MHVNLGPVTFSPGFSCDFPATLCPNCGTKSSLKAAVQTTKKTTSYFLLAGTELTFPFPLAVCQECMPTLERRPLSLVNKLFLTALVIGGVATFLLFSLQANQIHSTFVQNHLGLVSVLLGGGACAAWFGRQRPRDPQTSYYQPVRIQGLERKFSGEIQRLTLAFTNGDYLRAFSQVNSAPIKQGLLRAVSA